MQTICIIAKTASFELLNCALELIDRPIQLLYPLELHCEGITTANEDEKKNQLNPSAKEFRPKRTAAEIANGRLKDIAMEDDDDDI